MNKELITSDIIARFEAMNPHCRVIDIYTNEVGYWVLKIDITHIQGSIEVVYHGLEIVIGNHRSDIIRAYKPDKNITHDK